MKKGGTGGGNTITGLIYEAKVDLGTFLNEQEGYEVVGFEVYYKHKHVANLFKKYGLSEKEIQFIISLVRPETGGDK